MTTSRRSPPSSGRGARRFLLPLLAGLAACRGYATDVTAPGATSGPPVAVAGGGAFTPGLAACGTPTTLAAAPLRRLSRTEYLNTARDLFAGVTLPAVELPADKASDGFDNNVATQTATSVLVEGYAAAAKALADSVTDLRGFFGCDPAAAGCAGKFVRSFGGRALRRPVTDDEAGRYEAFFQAQVAAFGAEPAARLLVQAFLMSPSFLYRPEVGTPDPRAPGRHLLGGHEMASRLSYFLWQTMPDAELFAAAERGDLNDGAGVERQVRRMLGDPRARRAVGDFLRQWLALDEVKTINRDRALYPLFGPGVATALHDATVRTVERTFWDGDGQVSTLLTEPRAYANDTIARIYGLPAGGGAELVLRDLDPGQRAGLMTSAGIMAALAHDKTDAPILRGTYVLERFLCAPSPPPPANVPDIPPGQYQEKRRTTRERVEELHSVGACQSCHARIDPIGFLFSHYDALGQWRTEEDGLPVRAAAELRGVDADLDGPYADARALSARLAESPRVAECVARQMFRFSLGRAEGDGELCAIATAMQEAKGSLRELLVRLTTSDPFRYRRSPE